MLLRGDRSMRSVERGERREERREEREEVKRRGCHLGQETRVS